MKQVYADIIAGLEKAGAFKEVLGEPGIYPGYFFTSRRLDMRTTMINHRSRVLAFDIYMPLHAIMPFSKEWIEQAMTRSFSPMVMAIFSHQMQTVYAKANEYDEAHKQGYETRPLNKEPGYDVFRTKHGHPETVFMREFVKHHPEILAACVLMQVAHIEFLSQLDKMIAVDAQLLPEQRKIARKAVRALSEAFYRGEFISGPATYIAISYHDRITKDRSIAPDYSLPVTQQDFTQGWDKTIHRGGMEVHPGKDHVQQHRRACPWLNRAKIVSTELCAGVTDDEQKRDLAMGFGTWCIYTMLKTKDVAARHSKQYAFLMRPARVRKMADSFPFNSLPGIDDPA